LLAADVYRRDEIDASHYPVFHQMEGALAIPRNRVTRELTESTLELEARLAQAPIAIVDETTVGPSNPLQPEHDFEQASLVVRSLKAHLNSLVLALFGGRSQSCEGPLQVRWIDDAFPWTSPSFQVEVFYGGRWLEVLGCGVVMQDTLDRSGVPEKIGWAFGLGLDRLAMVLFSIPDIRLFWSEDSRFTSQFSEGAVSTFRPYSRYPSCYKDISFWLPEGFKLHNNDFFEIVRDIGGDLVEDTVLVDNFVHPTTNRRSLCFRIHYRSFDRNLSNDEVNVYHLRVTDATIKKWGVEVR